MHKCRRLDLTCYENAKGELWLSKDKYEQWRVDYCPFCGYEAERKLFREEILGKKGNYEMSSV